MKTSDSSRISPLRRECMSIYILMIFSLRIRPFISRQTMKMKKNDVLFCDQVQHIVSVRKISKRSIAWNPTSYGRQIEGFRPTTQIFSFYFQGCAAVQLAFDSNIRCVLIIWQFWVGASSERPRKLGYKIVSVVKFGPCAARTADTMCP